MYSPSGTASFFLYSTFSLALRKSAWGVGAKQQGEGRGGRQVRPREAQVLV